MTFDTSSSPFDGMGLFIFGSQESIPNEVKINRPMI
jgi:hypothetical protein